MSLFHVTQCEASPCFLDSSSSSPTSSSVTSDPVVYSSSSDSRVCCLWKGKGRTFYAHLICSLVLSQFTHLTQDLSRSTDYSFLLEETAG